MGETTQKPTVEPENGKVRVFTSASSSSKLYSTKEGAAMRAALPEMKNEKDYLELMARIDRSPGLAKIMNRLVGTISGADGKEIGEVLPGKVLFDLGSAQKLKTALLETGMLPNEFYCVEESGKKKKKDENLTSLIPKRKELKVKTRNISLSTKIGSSETGYSLTRNWVLQQGENAGMFSLGYDYLEQSRTPLLGWQNLCASINYGGADWMFESGWKPAGLKTPGGGLFLGPYTSEGVGLTWRAGIIQPNFLGGPIGDAVNLGKLAANDVVDGGWLAVIKAGADVTYSIIARVREKHKSKISKSKIKYEDASAALKDGKATIEQCVKVLTSGYNDEEKKKAAEKIYDIVNGLLNSGDSKALNQTDLKKLEKAVVKNEHYFNHEKLAIIRSYIDARRLDPGGSKTFGFAEKLANSKNMGLGMLGGLASSLFQVNELAIGIPARLKWHNGNVFESIFEGTFRFDHIKGAKNIFGKTLGLLKDTAGDIFKIATQTMQTISPIYFRSTELSEHARHNIRKAINENELLFKKENLNEKDWKTIDANVAYITKMAPMIIGMGSNRSIYAKLKQHIGKYGAYYEANSLETQPAHIYEESGYLMKKQYINPAFLNAYLSLKIMDMKGDIRQEQVANNALKKAEETINSSDFPENHRDAFNKALSNVFDLTSKNSRVVSDFSEALRQIVQNKGDLLKFYQESGGLFDLFREIHDISDYSSLHRTAFINAFSKQGDAAALKQAFTLAVELAANELEGLSRDIKEGKGIDREKYHNLTQQLVLMRWMMDLFPGVYSDASTQLMKSLIGPLKMMDDKPKKENPDAPLDQFRLAYTVLCLGLIPQEYIASHQGAFDNITTLLRKSEYYGAASEIEMKLK